LVPDDTSKVRGPQVKGLKEKETEILNKKEKKL